MRYLVATLFALSVFCNTDSVAQTSAAVPEGSQFVASRQGRTFYWIGCDAWRSLSRANLVFFPSRSAAESAGFTISKSRGCSGPSGGVAVRGESRAAGLLELPSCTIANISDGDTVRCADGRRIRLLLIDAPETSQGDFGLRAKLALEELAPVGSTILLRRDREEKDRYGRTLAHLFTKEGLWVNREMVLRGYAIPVSYAPNIARFSEIQAAGEEAKAVGRGLWSGGGFVCKPSDHRQRRC